MSASMKIVVNVDDSRARQAFARAPAVMRQFLGDALWRGALEIARMAREKAPKLFSTLTQSINAAKISDLHWRVDAGTKYAVAAEEGTGPAAGHARYYPNPDSLQQYLMHSPNMRRHSWARLGSAKRGEQSLNIWFRSRALAWYIYQHGTRAQPYMAPAAVEGESRVIALIRTAAQKGALEVMR